MKTLMTLPLLTTVLLAPLAFAEPPKQQGLYIGGGYGLLKIKDADDFDDDNNAIQGVIGGQINRFIAIEGSYIDFGEYGGNIASATTDGKTLALKLMLPVTDRVSLYGKGGQLWWNTDYKVLGFKGDADGSEPFFGAGVSVAVTDHLFVDFDYTRYQVKFEEDEAGVFANGDFDADLDFANAGVRYLF